MQLIDCFKHDCLASCVPHLLRVAGNLVVLRSKLRGEYNVAMRSANAQCIRGHGRAGVSSLRQPRCVHSTPGPVMIGCSAVALAR